MSEDTKKPAEFRRYRQGLTTLYFAVAAFGFVLLSSSVIKQLLFHSPRVSLQGPRLSAEDPNPSELLQCNDDVQVLLEDLGKQAATLMQQAPPQRVSRRWTAFSHQWRDRWHEINLRCRFKELVNTDMGTAYDRMASVHGDLPAMRLKYEGLIGRFDDEQAAELGRMHRALELSHAALQERADRSRE